MEVFLHGHIANTFNLLLDTLCHKVVVVWIFLNVINFLLAKTIHLDVDGVVAVVVVAVACVVAAVVAVASSY